LVDLHLLIRDLTFCNLDPDPGGKDLLVNVTDFVSSRIGLEDAVLQLPLTGGIGSGLVGLEC
jgi:hypothetical protein